MRVIYFIHSLYGAGTTNQAHTVCHHLKNMGMDISLLAGSSIGENQDKFKTADYPVEFLSQTKLSNPELTLRLAGYLRQNPDVLLLSGAKKVNMKAITAHKLSRIRRLLF